MKVWASYEECRAGIRDIRYAVGEHYNRRGGPVYGKDNAGEWHKLQSAAAVKGVPHGYRLDGSVFVLRAAEVRPR